MNWLSGQYNSALSRETERDTGLALWEIQRTYSSFFTNVTNYGSLKTQPKIYYFRLITFTFLIILMGHFFRISGSSIF